MKRDERAVEHTGRPCAIKVNGCAAAREMGDALDCSSFKGGSDCQRQVLRCNGTVDHEGVDLDALGRHRSGEIAGTILACEIEYFITSAIMAANQLRQRLFVAVGRSDVGEAH